MGLVWLLTISAAFCQVREPKFTGSALAVGVGIFIVFLLVASCRYFFPDLANSFTEWGLILFCSVIASFVAVVPMLQYLWDVEYHKATGTILLGLVFFGLLMAGISGVLQPEEGIAARLRTPLFVPQELQGSTNR